MDISAKLALRPPKLIDGPGFRRASVALILDTGGSEPRVLFIERARKKSDPWSGQIAFPGGNRDPEDVDIMDTALRETREEVGVTLNRVQCIGRLDDQQGRTNYRAIPLVISCFVFELNQQPQLANNPSGN